VPLCAVVISRDPSSLVRFSGVVPNTTFAVTDVMSLTSMAVENGVFSLGTAPTTSNVQTLTLRNAALTIPAFLTADRIDIGGDSSASIGGPGKVAARELNLRSGGVSAAEVITTNFTIAPGTSAKDILSPSFVVNGASRVSGPGPLRFGPNVLLHIADGASLTVDKGADLLDMSRALPPPTTPAATTSDAGGEERKAVAAMNISRGGVVQFADQSRVSLMLLNDGRIVVGTSKPNEEGTSKSGGVVTFMGPVSLLRLL
jgi:hypothetical protein